MSPSTIQSIKLPSKIRPGARARVWISSIEQLLSFALVELGNYLRAQFVIWHFYMWLGRCFRTPHQIKYAKYKQMIVSPSWFTT